LREVRILEQLDHPRIVAFRESGEANGRFFFAMDHVRGKTVDQLVKTRGPLNTKLAVRIICQVLEALRYAHRRKFVHRDIKPANILIADEEGRRAVKLADFGLAKVYHASQLSGLTMTGEIGGTPQFMAPEHITNYRDVQPAADQYSTAVTLYYMLTKAFPIDVPAHFALAILAVLEKDPVPIAHRRPDTPKGLAKAIHRALSREPKDRFPNVEAFRKALAPFGR
jgi:serine/threonine-protein kinase